MLEPEVSSAAIFAEVANNLLALEGGAELQNQPRPVMTIQTGETAENG